mmetsp:Transcript_81462/g.213865  ORF Transcript_81462/g.213865 Transcript_81462/m.213865 type:complete len:371 (-) Transcript_81462:853-1965(-)
MEQRRSQPAHAPVVFRHLRDKYGLVDPHDLRALRHQDRALGVHLLLCEEAALVDGVRLEPAARVAPHDAQAAGHRYPGTLRHVIHGADHFPWEHVQPDDAVGNPLQALQRQLRYSLELLHLVENLRAVEEDEVGFGEDVEHEDLLRHHAAPIEDVVQVGLDLLLNDVVGVDIAQVLPGGRQLLVEVSPALGELEEGLRDLSDADREGRQCKEHEDQDEDSLRQVHRRHLRGHRAHHAQRPVEAEHVALGGVLLQPGPGGFQRAEVSPHRRPVRDLVGVPLLCLVVEDLGEEAPWEADHPEDAGVPVANQNDHEGDAEQGDELQREHAQVHLDPLPDRAELGQAEHPDEPQETDELDDLGELRHLRGAPIS